MYFETLLELKENILNMDLHEKDELLILVGDKSYYHVNELIEFSNEENVKIFGGIYSGLLVGDKCHSEGFIIQKYTPVYTSVILPYMMRCNLDFTKLKNATALVLVDGLSSQMKALADTIYKKLDKNVKYIGGGAGFYSLEHKPCLFNNKGIFKDAMIISIIEANSVIEVEHGWHKLAGPFRVTDSLDNVLRTLDYDHAFEVYKHVIEDEANLTLFKSDFFEFAKDYPFGIIRDDKSHIVRDPIALNENSEIINVANIPIDCEVDILNGDIDSLMAASIKISRRCSRQKFENYRPLLFDCISRSMFMNDRFEEELENIQQYMDVQVEGALSIGEVSSIKDGSLQIHNKSTVLGLLEL